MSVAYKCDKCGNLFDKDQGKMIDKIHVNTTFRTGLYEDADICNACAIPILEALISHMREEGTG